jgi:hypothetical protein
VEILVVPKDRVFLHGKAGVIEAADGAKICFLGSINETKRAFAGNYEILWEDTPRRGGHCAVGSVFAGPGASRCGGAAVGAVVTARVSAGDRMGSAAPGSGGSILGQPHGLTDPSK